MPKEGKTIITWSSGLPEYFGHNNRHNASEDDDDWEVTKYAWDGADLQNFETLIGSWTDRGSLDW